MVRRGNGPGMLLLRRVAAAALLLLAGILVLRSETGAAVDEVPVLVAAHDLAPGSSLRPDDVSVRRIPSELAPEGALREPGDVEGRVLAGAARSGETITDVRLVGAALTDIATGRDEHAAVPIRLADPAVADLLYPGRKVDVIAAATRSGDADVLAERVPVVAVRPAEGRQERGRLVVVGLPAPRAAAVASAALEHPVTVTLR